MRQIFRLLSLLLLICLLVSCGQKNTVSLLDPLAADDAAQRLAVRLSVYDGTSCRSARLLEHSEGAGLLERLRAEPARLAAPDEVPALSLPIYGITGEKPDGSIFRLAFTRDYCITEDGLYYRFWFDFDDALAGLSLNWSESDAADFPCAPILFVEDHPVSGAAWRAELMQAAPVQTVTPPAGISAALGQWNGSTLTVAFRNDSGAVWGYGNDFTIEVCLDGGWYSLPYAMHDRPIERWLVSYTIADSKSAEQSYAVSTLYGTPACRGGLPAGHYRIVTNGTAVEFEVN